MAMKNTVWLLIIPVIFLASCGKASKEADFNPNSAWQELENVLNGHYAYLERDDLNTLELFSDFKVQALKTKNEQEFQDVAQMLLRHFYDPHLNLGPYNNADYSVFPTGSDMRALQTDNKFIIEDVKAESDADRVGVKPGLEIIKVDGVPVAKALEDLFGKTLEQLSLKQINYGVNVVLGGIRNQKRVLEVRTDIGVKTIELASSYQWLDETEKGPALSYKKLDNIGYIRFNNSLGNSATIDMFKAAVIDLLETDALIIDLRNTPSGGNTGVAEPIMGHFVDKKAAYQRYQVQEEGLLYYQAKMKTAYVEPTLPHYNKPFVVLAGRWTGSMGEGMTIGLDAIGATAIIGAPMADLLGGIKTVTLEESNTWLELGFERLYHINNSFREDFTPNILINPADRDVGGRDPALTRAMVFLNDKVLNSL